MAILSKGTTYADGDQITSTNLNALVDSATFASGAVESGGGVQLNGSGQLKVGGNVDIGTSNLTATGTISLGATSFNDNDITNVGSIALDTITNDGTDVTIDSSGDITLDAGDADIRLKDDGTQFGRLANSSSNLVVASSISDKDILFQGSDGGSTITALTLDMSDAGAATFNNKITAVGTSVFTNLDISGDVDIDGTINLDAVDIDGNVQIDGTVTVGVDDTGYDVKFFGATSGAYIQFDASADKLLTAGGATIDIVKDKLLIGGTAVTTTAAELNVLDGVTAGTVTASKGIVVDSNKDIASFRNITLTGELDAGSLDVSGDADIDGTLETDALSIASTAVTATAAELNYNDTGASVGTVVASKTVTVDSNKDVSGFRNVSLETLTNATTDFTIDSSGDIVLDADGAQVRIKDAGTERFIFNTGAAAELDVLGTSVTIHSNTSNADIIFKGNDGGSSVDALTLDMSEAGAATFNDKIIATELDISGDIDIDGTTNLDVVDIDGAVDMASTLAVAGDAAFDTDTLFVDVSADKVGINDSTPSEALDVSGTAKVSSQLYLKRDSDAWTTTNTWINVNDFGVINTGGAFALTMNGNGYRGTAGWTSFGQNSEDGATQIHQYPQGYMTFNANSDWPTTTDGTNKTVTERMRIHGDTGNVSIGTTSASEKLTVSGNVSISGSLSKGSGSFKIPHPLESKRDTHNLVHSFLESPQADLIYRGRVDLVDGVASVNIDTASDMTDGTFVLLCRDVQSFTTNESGWTAVRSSVEGNILTIEAQDNTCTDSISWMVVGERQDEHMYDTGWTDDDGKVIVEPLIPEPTPEPDVPDDLDSAAPEPEAEEEAAEE
jgi:cytoskeletal protein CcmA (bactofilin family)